MPKYVGGSLYEATGGQDVVPELITNAIRALRPCTRNFVLTCYCTCFNEIIPFQPSNLLAYLGYLDLRMR